MRHEDTLPLEVGYAALLEALPVALFVTDASGRRLYANVAARSLLGKGVDTIITSASDLAEIYGAYVAGTDEPYPPERMPVVRALSGETSTVDDMEIRQPDGARRIQVRAAPILDADGDVDYAVAVFEDISERKRAEDELNLALDVGAAIAHGETLDEGLEIVLRTVCDRTGWVLGQVWIPSGDGPHLVCGRAWYSVSAGFEDFREASTHATFEPGAGLPGRVWASKAPAWVTDVTVDPHFRRAALAQKAGLGAGAAVPVVAGDEVVAVMEFFLFHHRQRDEEFLHLVSSLSAQLGALVRRKQAEQALRESEARFRALAETAKDGIVSADSTGRIVYFNQEAERMFGYAAREASRSPVTILIPERFHEAHRRGFGRFLATGERRVIGHTVELAARRKDGSEFPVELSLATWRAGDEPYFTAILRDVTERKRAREELEVAFRLEQEATAQLRALDQMKNTLLHAVAHDLRDPLSAILGSALLLESDLPRAEPKVPPEKRLELVRNTAASARKMSRLLKDLIDLDRLILGILEPDRRPTDVGKLVRDLVEGSPLGRDHPVHVEAEPVVARIDAPKVERIVDNLLGNAAKHTPEGSPVWVRASPRNGGVEIAVEDSGGGVPDELKEAIFEPFRQGPDRHGSAGVGIGLSLVARFAELHGGRAWVEDRPGGGASFRVFLADTAEPLSLEPTRAL